MEVQDQPDIEFPVVHRLDRAARRRADRDREPDHPAGRGGGADARRGREHHLDRAARAARQTMVEFELGTDITEAVNEVEERGRPDPRRTARRHPRAATSSKQQTSSRADRVLRRHCRRHDDRAAVVVHRRHGHQAAAVGRRPGRGRAATAGSTARSWSSSIRRKMQSLGVTASQVNTALRQLNVNAAGGQAEIAGSRQSVRVLGNAAAPTSCRRPRSRSAAGARSSWPTSPRSATATANCARSPRSTASRWSPSRSPARAANPTSRSTMRAIEVLEQIETENPGIKFTRLFTEVDYTKAQYESSMAAMIEGAMLAVIVVFLFLRDWRATIIAALAIPLSAIPTFWSMDLLGFTLNTLSLLALGLVAGVLVDDAIVEIENIVRHMRMGKSAYQASIDAADEIGLAVVATTFSIVAVFLPVGLMPGVSGQFFKNFGLTVVVSVLMSPGGRAHDHADDRGLFPQGQGPRRRTAKARGWTATCACCAGRSTRTRVARDARAAAVMCPPARLVSRSPRWSAGPGASSRSCSGVSAVAVRNIFADAVAGLDPADAAGRLRRWRAGRRSSSASLVGALHGLTKPAHFTRRAQYPAGPLPRSPHLDDRRSASWRCCSPVVLFVNLPQQFFPDQRQRLLAHRGRDGARHHARADRGSGRRDRGAHVAGAGSRAGARHRARRQRASCAWCSSPIARAPAWSSSAN